MKTGKTISQLAQELETLATSKRDFVAPTGLLRFGTAEVSPRTPQQPPQNIPRLLVMSTENDATGRPMAQAELELSDHAFHQVTEWAGVPRKYADRMLSEAPGLLRQNVQHWLDSKRDTRMVRAIGSKGRAFLSNRYRRIENENLLAAAMPTLMEQARDHGLRLLATEVTENRMYIQAAYDTISEEVKRGDLVRAGFTFSNSEIGGGAVVIDPFVHRLACLNGLIVPMDVESGRLRRTHLGRQIAAEEAREIFKDDTIEADDRALMLKVRDAIQAMSNKELFLQVIDQMRRAASTEIKDVQATIERVGDAFQLPQASQAGILANMIRGADLSMWGLVNAVTALAHEADSFDSNIELQRIGGRILTADYKTLVG